MLGYMSLLLLDSDYSIHVTVNMFRFSLDSDYSKHVEVYMSISLESDLSI